MKNKWTLFFLCLFLGPIGAHKFYEGKVGMGLLYLFTFGLFGIGWLVDLIAILAKPDPRNSSKQKHGKSPSKTKIQYSQSPAPSPVRTAPLYSTAPQLAHTQKVASASVPLSKGGVSLAYQYILPFVPSNPDAALKAFQKERPYLTASLIDGYVHLSDEGIDLGVLSERADMMQDWLRRKDPYLVILGRDGKTDGFTITLAFYRDKPKQYAGHKHSIVGLTAYKSQAKQDTIMDIDEDAELDAEEDYDTDGRVVVSYTGDPIGNLPKKEAERFIEEGAELIVFDHGEENDDLIIRPFVRIYW